MSSDDTKEIGDLHKLPYGAPPGLKALFAFGEGVIQEQVELLGSGKPSEAPDPVELLNDAGIDKPEDKGEMIDNYSGKQDEMEEATSEHQRNDDGVAVSTAGIGEVVTNAYDAIDESVGELNDKIDAAQGQEEFVVEDDFCGLRLPNSITNDLFEGLWETLNTVYEKVNNVSDEAAAEALNISDNEPNYPTTDPNTNPGGVTPPGSYPTGSGGEITPVSDTGSMGTAIVPTEDKPDAMAMMEYLIEEHDFTPEQAAGIVANARYESHFDVSATGDNGTAHGLFQWRFGRHEGLQEYASRDGEDIGDWRTHIDYMVTELRGGSYEEANNIVSNSTDEREVAEAFDRHYERSSGHTINDRREYAAGVLKEWNASNSDQTVAV